MRDGPPRMQGFTPRIGGGPGFSGGYRSDMPPRVFGGDTRPFRPRDDLLNSTDRFPMRGGFMSGGEKRNFGGPGPNRFGGERPPFRSDRPPFETIGGGMRDGPGPAMRGRPMPMRGPPIRV